MELTPDEQRYIEARRATKAIEDGGPSIGWILDALYALIQVGMVIWPNFELWDILQRDVEANDSRPRP
ncbi:MAG TPA: hypothetical protein VFH61_01770 [Thermoleophilia bacterium]|nr:hypothetical protein [Thermoleophilia bacterium]